MKHRVKYSFIFLLVISLLLVGCSSKNNESEFFEGNYATEDEIEEENDSTPNRKIIYKVNADLSTNNLSESIATIKNTLDSDEWLDSEDISNNRASLIIRVKTEHLDDFLNSINESHDVSNFNKTATDISLKYQDKSNLILTYQTERERLVELYEQASLSDMILINTRLSEIDIEIGKLQGELNHFDSLVDYSEVRLNLYTSVVSEHLPFGQRLLNAFSNGFWALIVFFDTLVIVLITLLPWIIVITPIGYGVYRIRKYTKKKKLMTNNTKNDKDYRG